MSNITDTAPTRFSHLDAARQCLKHLNFVAAWVSVIVSENVVGGTIWQRRGLRAFYSSAAGANDVVKIDGSWSPRVVRAARCRFIRGFTLHAHGDAGHDIVD